MHDVVTTSTAPQTYFLNTQDDLLPAITLTNRHHTIDTNSWHDSDSDRSETWPPKQDNSPKPGPFTRSSPAGFQKLPHHSKMSSLSDSKLTGNNHWLYNANGQLVDVEADSASAGWDLADEIVRLKIGDVAGESGEDATIRTPPKKLTSTLLTETSPLESSSVNSIDSSPPSDHQAISHSRGSSTDTTESSSHDSALSGASNTLLSNSVNDTPPKERPHSYSGGLSNADLRHLQQAGDADGTEVQQSQWNQYRESGNEQLSYPSLTNNTVSIHRPQAQVASQLFDYRTAPPGGRDDLQIDYNLQQRNFNPLPPAGMSGPGGPPSFVQRPTNGVPLQFRQTVRGYPQPPGILPSPPTMGYPGGHTAHMSLGNSQQLYDMMVPPSHDNPAVSRVQQQSVFRGAHQHSASDPSTLRDQQIALMGNAMQFAPGMYQPGMAPQSIAMYANQYYSQDAYNRDSAMTARIQSQFTGPYNMLPPQMDGMSSPTSVDSSGQNGPSANNRKLGLYKTELCRSWEEKGSCRYGAKCQFAHGEDELRKVQRHPKYKTEICRTFWVSGSCPYGKRCCFIHTELPTQGGATPQDAPPPPSRSDGRARSMSTNSDPNEGNVSILARISAKRNQDSSTNSSSTPVDGPNNGYPFTRPPTGSLRVDTSTLDGTSMKQQNKSAYPAFASNGVLLPSVDRRGTKSPAPVTAGPDLGRHNNARIDIVGHGYNQRVNSSATPPSNSSVRHSFNGEDVNFTPSQPTAGHSYTLSTGDNGIPTPQRGPGHGRSGSAGNWANLTRNGHLSSASFSHGTGGGDSINSPWSTTELTMSGSRLHEKAWA